MSPFILWVLHTHETAPGLGTGHRAYGFQDEAAAKALGERLKAERPGEATSFGYTVLPLEGPPGTESNTND